MNSQINSLERQHGERGGERRSGWRSLTKNHKDPHRVKPYPWKKLFEYVVVC